MFIFVSLEWFHRFLIKSRFVYPEIMKTTQLYEYCRLFDWVYSFKIMNKCTISHTPSVGCSDFKCSPHKAIIPTDHKKRKQHWMLLQPFCNVLFILQFFYNVSVLYIFMSIYLILLFVVLENIRFFLIQLCNNSKVTILSKYLIKR
jgi:hypothetical protein